MVCFLGNSNLGSLGNLNKVGKKFVQHAGSQTILYHITTKDANVVKK